MDVLSASTPNKLYVAVYAILAISPGYQRAPCGGGLLGSVLGMRVIQATLILEYLAAGTSKAFYGDWLKHSDVVHTQMQGIFRTDFAAWCLRAFPQWIWTVVQWLTLLFELEAPLLFCTRCLRPLAFIFGICLHVVIALMMKDLFFLALRW